MLDLWVVERLPPNARIVMIASGGCTAALLCASPRTDRIHLVDPNPAQLALTRLKLNLLQGSEAVERLRLLGHMPLPAEDRCSAMDRLLAELEMPATILGPPSWVAEVGPDHAGRYERVFAALQHSLREVEAKLQRVLSTNDCNAQSAALSPETSLGRRLDDALDAVMSLPILVRLFGAEATNNPVESFSRHFAGRIRHALSTLPAATNPFLWQMLAGRFPDNVAYTWLRLPRLVRLPEIAVSNRFMAEVLEGASLDHDFVHLSNILDWLSPERAAATLDLAWKALRSGGFILVRQLNSSLDIPSLGPQFEWLTSESEELHRRDRSFFYRALHLGRKR